MGNRYKRATANPASPPRDKQPLRKPEVATKYRDHLWKMPSITPAQLHFLALQIAYIDPVREQQSALHYQERQGVDTAAMDYEDKILLVYEHKTKGRKIIPNGTAMLSELDLIMLTSEYCDVIIRKKAIKPGSTSIEILKTDLMDEDEKAAAMAKGVKAEEVPWMTFLGHEFEKHRFEELTILALAQEATGPKKAEPKTVDLKK
ncbi:hypothetical protein AC579_8948 [Pseudocercospora musae]|uniref:Uncharacterized protein n=1 Tax=Pseudocercospora musae TaxID=113226 RepID=A0A139I4M9_9PEZI|nr:hypothetical protein AC579_8948 [Pseudocercospora musae]KXT09704.1 hypothetical protein AC579_8948 [Pseudocercospora musae]